MNKVASSAGHDWRVPVMRPSAAQEFNGWYCAHCQRGVDASEVTFHEQHEVCGHVITDDRPPSPQPSQAIDLEQFRAALVALSDYAYERHGDTDHPHCLEADRLLALINQQPNVRSSSEHSDSLPATRSNTTHNLEKERGEDGKNG